MMKKFLKKIKLVIKKVWKLILELPVFRIDNKKIVFDNFNGKGFGCNPKYIALELIKKNIECKMIWLVNDMNTDMPKEIKKIKYGSLKAYYELATAKIWVDNVKNYKGIKKKKKQFYIQTWHASYSPKYLENDAKNKLNSQYLKESKKDSKETDLFLSNSNIQSVEYRNAFWCTCDILESGYPRNDIFFSEDIDMLKDRIRYKLNINKNQKIILYAPTFRDNNSINGYGLDCERLLKNKKFLNDDVLILIRMHPNMKEYRGLFNFENTKIKDVTNYPDIQELLLISDILITDYSTTMFDFSLMNKEVIIFAEDIDEYKKMRGLKDIYFKLPFTICKNNDELEKNIEKFDNSIYQEKIKNFKDKYKAYDKGNASKIVTEKIQKIIKGGNI